MTSTERKNMIRGIRLALVVIGCALAVGLLADIVRAFVVVILLGN